MQANILGCLPVNLRQVETNCKQPECFFRLRKTFLPSLVRIPWDFIVPIIRLFKWRDQIGRNLVNLSSTVSDRPCRKVRCPKVNKLKFSQAIIKEHTGKTKSLF
jgi:hypothetical protein